MHERVGTKAKGEHRKKEGGKEAELKVQKEGERTKKMFAPQVSPIMIGHSFEDGIATVYSGKRVMRK